MSDKVVAKLTGAMYPWELSGGSQAPQEPQGQPDTANEAFPWLSAAEEDVATATVLEEDPPSPAERQLVETIATDLKRPPQPLAYSAPAETNWLPLVGLVCGTALLGALAVWWTQPSAPDAIAGSNAASPVRPPANPTETPKPQKQSPEILLKPEQTRPLVEKTLKAGGRPNPFRTALPDAAPALVPPAKIEVLKPAPPPPPPAPPVLTLMSVAISGSTRAAVIQVSKESDPTSTYEVTLGDTVEGWIVKDINNARVLLVKGGKTKNLFVQ